MHDAVAGFRAASEANDIDALMATIAPDAELVSPISGRMVFRGSDDVRVLLTAVYGTLTSVRWRQEVGESTVRVVTGDAVVGPLTLGDAMVLELNGDGQVRVIRPHLRPWLGLTLLALRLAPRVGRHPGVVWRALRRA